MASAQRLTSNSSETDLNLLLSGETVFSIPFFQRGYKWEKKQVLQFTQDLLKPVDDPTITHFLGAIIIHGRPTDPSDPKVYEVIDGQQRLTTIFLCLCAIARTFSKKGEYSEAAALFLKYLVINREISLISNSKLHSSKDDRAQLNQVFSELLLDKNFKERLPQFTYRPLPTAGDSGRLYRNYRLALKFFESQVETEGIERLRALYRALVYSMTLVQIDVTDPTNGPKIFDCLNSRQEPMTTGDLVRNEIFAKVANQHPDRIEAIDQACWQPFYKKFSSGEKNLFDDYFFPYGLVLDPNVRKSEVYSRLREEWKKIEDPATIVSQLAEFQDAFLDFKRDKRPGSRPRGCQAFLRLKRSKAPSSTYPFLMRISNAAKGHAISEKDSVSVLQAIESFLVRRAVCGHEPTGLHAVFKRLWNDCEGAINAERVAAEIRKHKTVVWPSDEDVKGAVMKRPIAGSSITNYLLQEWNHSLGGDIPSKEPWIEHVLPVKATGEWLVAFTPEQRSSMTDLFANLLPLSDELNRVVSNGPYDSKRSKYVADSGFKAARQFGLDYGEWTPERLEARGAVLASWVLEYWPG